MYTNTAQYKVNIPEILFKEALCVYQTLENAVVSSSIQAYSC